MLSFPLLLLFFYYLYAPWRPHSYISSFHVTWTCITNVSVYSYNLLTTDLLSLDFCTCYIIQYLIYIPIYHSDTRMSTRPTRPLKCICQVNFIIWCVLVSHDFWNLQWIRHTQRLRTDRSSPQCHAFFFSQTKKIASWQLIPFGLPKPIDPHKKKLR